MLGNVRKWPGCGPRSSGAIWAARANAGRLSLVHAFVGIVKGVRAALSVPEALAGFQQALHALLGFGVAAEVQEGFAFEVEEVLLGDGLFADQARRGAIGTGGAASIRPDANKSAAGRSTGADIAPPLLLIRSCDID